LLFGVCLLKIDLRSQTADVDLLLILVAGELATPGSTLSSAMDDADKAVAKNSSASSRQSPPPGKSRPGNRRNGKRTARASKEWLRQRGKAREPQQPEEKASNDVAFLAKPEPWPEPLDATKLLEEITGIIGKHISMNEHQPLVAALSAISRMFGSACTRASSGHSRVTRASSLVAFCQATRIGPVQQTLLLGVPVES
jgi:hypothetical protein